MSENFIRRYDVDSVRVLAIFLLIVYHSVIGFQPWGKDVYFIRGEVAVEDRDKVKNIMENKNNIVCVAISKIFSTGINIKNLHYIVFAHGGKAKIKIIQSIGRGLRLHNDKHEVIIFDMADNLYYGLQHMKKRLQLYNREGFSYGTREFEE